MRVIVTGASGFIGRNVLLRAPRDWEIVALYHRTPTSTRSSPTRARRTSRSVRCDLLDARGRRAARAGRGTERADAVLYLAANGDPAVSAERPRWDLESNTTALVTFLEHCPAGHLSCSSRPGAVYDGLVGPCLPRDAGRAAPAVRDFEARLRALPPLLCRDAAQLGRQLRQRAVLRRLRSVRGGAQDHDAAGCARWPQGSATSSSAATART